MTLLIGADPEVFFRKGEQFISAHTLLPGTKIAPYPVPFGAVQVDGTAGEFNIDPAATEDEFVLHVSEVKKHLESMLDYDVTIEIVPSVEWPLDYMEKLPGDAKKLGCDPDYNAYLMDANPKPEHEGTCLRGAGGHLHVGWTTGADPHSAAHFEACCVLAKQLDYYVGLPSLIIDSDTRRKKLVKAGAFRPKSYGMEYRVISNYWVAEEGLMRLVYANTVTAFKKLSEGAILSEKYGDAAKNIINSNNKDAAVELCNDIGIPFWPMV